MQDAESIKFNGELDLEGSFQVLEILAQEARDKQCRLLALHELAKYLPAHFDELFPMFEYLYVSDRDEDVKKACITALKHTNHEKVVPLLVMENERLERELAENVATIPRTRELEATLKIDALLLNDLLKCGTLDTQKARMIARVVDNTPFIIHGQSTYLFPQDEPLISMAIERIREEIGVKEVAFN